MTEVILNDECLHCNDKECHDGEHFCRQAMKDNSFYKNARLYKGLEVIQRPTYEDLEKENAELKNRNAELKGMYAHSAREAGTYKQFLELKEKENANLEEKISVLLSCKNCPDNKGGLLCQKEYEDKCLAQKIQYIKELKEENAELKEKLSEQKLYTEFKCNEAVKKRGAYEKEHRLLTNAKEIIKRLMDIINHDLKCFDTMAGLDVKQKAMKFLKKVDK